MEIYFAKSTPVTVNNITFSLSGRKLEIAQNGYTRTLEVRSGDAYYCQKGIMAQKWCDNLSRGEQILHALGIPKEKWATSYADFENRRKEILDSHKITLSDTYVRDDYTYMTCNIGSKTKLLLAWVSDNVSSKKQLTFIQLALKDFGTESAPGFLVLI